MYVQYWGPVSTKNRPTSLLFLETSGKPTGEWGCVGLWGCKKNNLARIGPCISNILCTNVVCNFVLPRQRGFITPVGGEGWGFSFVGEGGISVPTARNGSILPPRPPLPRQH